MTEPPYRAEGARLQRARKQLGLTQAELAKKIQASLPAVKGYERGMRMPNRTFAGRLAEIGVNMEFIVNGDGPPVVPASLRRVHADMIARALAASEPASAYAARDQLDQLQTVAVSVAGICSRMQFAPPMQWTALVQELMLVDGLTERGARRILETLKEDEGRR